MLVSQGLKTYIVCSPISLYGREAQWRNKNDEENY